jgi:hypothetical protein
MFSLESAFLRASMTINKRIPNGERYAAIHEAMARDFRLSSTDWRVMIHLLSRTENWRVCQAETAKSILSTEREVRRSLIRLESFGYGHRVIKNGDKSSYMTDFVLNYTSPSIPATRTKLSALPGQNSPPDPDKIDRVVEANPDNLVRVQEDHPDNLVRIPGQFRPGDPDNLVRPTRTILSGSPGQFSPTTEQYRNSITEQDRNSITEQEENQPDDLPSDFSSSDLAKMSSIELDALIRRGGEISEMAYKAAANKMEAALKFNFAN